MSDYRGIYVIGSPEFRPLKIGTTSQVRLRRATMQSGCPYKLHLYAFFCGPEAGVDMTEKQVHSDLKGAGKHHRGEWFNIGHDEATEAVLAAGRKVGAVLEPPATVLEMMRGLIEATPFDASEAAIAARDEMVRLARYMGEVIWLQRNPLTAPDV